MLSRALGFVREILMAAFFGTSLAQSAFVVAFRIPNLFRRLFGEGALSAAFVPVFTRSLEKEGHGDAWSLAGRVVVLLGVLLALIVITGETVVSVVLNNMAVTEKATLVLSLLRIVLPYMLFICLVALCMAILNSFHHFLVPAITPVILNVIWILTLVLICPRFGATAGERIYGVAWGILLAGVVQLAVQVPILIRYGFKVRMSLVWQRDARVRDILLLMGPAALGMGVTQVNVFVDTMLALWIGEWAPAALSFAERLIYLPLGVFATALGTVLLPVLSRQAARAEPSEIRKTLNRSLRSLMFVMIPAAAGLFVLARPVIELVFQRGAFDEWSTILTARALRCYAPGLIVFGLYKVFVPGFYALKDAKTPVKVGLWAVFLNVLLNITFLLTLPLHFKHAGLAAATVLAGAVNVIMLARKLTLRAGSPCWPKVLRSWASVTVASGVMATCAFLTHRWLACLTFDAGLSSIIRQLLSVGGSIAAGLAVYGALTTLLCRDELKALSGVRLSHKD